MSSKVKDEHAKESKKYQPTGKETAEESVGRCNHSLFHSFRELFFRRVNRMLVIGASDAGLTDDNGESFPPFPQKLNSATTHMTLIYANQEMNEIKRENVERQQYGDYEAVNDKNTSSASSVSYLLRTLLKTHWYDITFLSFLKLLQITLSFSCPVFLNMIVDFVSSDSGANNNSNRDLKYGCFILTGLFMSFLLTAIVNTQITLYSAQLQIKINSALQQSVFCRMLSLPLSEWVVTEGTAISIIQVDTERLAQCFANISDLWGMPLQVGIALIFLYIQVEFVFLVGLAVIIIVLLLNIVITKQIGMAAAGQLQAKDARMNVLIEALRCILPIKMMSMETFIQIKVNESRTEELKYLRRKKYLDALCVCLWVTLPCLVPYATFAASIMYHHSDNDNDIDKQHANLSVTDVFTTLALLQMLIFPMNAFPWVLNGCAEALVSCRRIALVLWSDDDNVGDGDDECSGSSGKLCLSVADYQITSQRPWVFNVRQGSGKGKRKNVGISESEDAEDEAEDKEKERQRQKNNDGSREKCMLNVQGATWQWSDKSHTRTATNASESGGKKNSTSLLLQGKEEASKSKSISNSASETPFTIALENLHLEGAQVVGIIGAVGSGKTAFLLSLTGELHMKCGNCTTNTNISTSTISTTSTSASSSSLFSYNNNDIAFCPELPVIHSCSMRENIVFGSVFNQERYDIILKGCCLYEEIQALPAKDATMVSSTRLSGGQRLRIGIARTLYCQTNSRVILLDSPFGALDDKIATRVRDFIFKYSRDEHALVLITTHNTRLLNGVDVCISIECLSDRASVSTSNDDVKYEDDYKSNRSRNGKSNVRVHLLGSSMYEMLLASSSSSTLTQASASESVSTEAVRTSTCSENNSNDQVDNIVGSDISHSDSNGTGSKHIETALLVSENEILVVGSVKSDAYWAYFHSFGKCNSLMLLISMIGMQGTSDGIAIYYSYWADNMSVISSAMFLHTAGFIVTVNLCFALLRSFVFAKGALTACKSIYERLTTSIFRTSMHFFDQTPIGSITNRFGKDTNIVDDPLAGVLNIVIAQSFMLMGNLVVISIANYYITAVLLIVMILYYRVQTFYRKTSRALRRLQSISRSPFYSMVSDCFSNGAQIRSLQSVNYFALQASDLIDSINHVYYASCLASCWLSMRLQLLGALVAVSMAAIAIFGSLCGYSDMISPGTLGLATIYTFSLVAKLNSLVSSSTELEQEMISVERICEYTNLEDEQEEILGLKYKSDSKGDTDRGEDTTDTNLYDNDTDASVHSPLIHSSFLVDNSVKAEVNVSRNATRERGHVRFEKVSMRYAEHLQDAVHDISFTIEAGSCVAIVGRTGSGKSSLFRLISRLNNPYNGRIFLDDVNAATLDVRMLRSRLFVISQDPLLFSGTIRSNVDPESIHTSEEILHSLTACGFMETVSIIGHEQDKDRSDILEKNIEENGSNISLGQKQLLCLARALLSREYDVLLIDEGTSSVDKATCARMKKALLNLWKLRKCTILIITHSKRGFYTLCDSVITLYNGKIVSNTANK